MDITRIPRIVMTLFTVALLSIAGKAVSAEPVTATVFKAVPAARTVTMTAFTRPRVTMTLVSEESSKCLNVYADKGDTIRADGLIARLDPTFIKLEIESLKADQEKLQSDVLYYSKEVERYSKLVKNNTAAQSDLDLHLRDMKRAKAQLRAIKAKLKINNEHLKRYILRAPSGWKVITRYLEPGEWAQHGEKVADLGNFKTLLVPYAFTYDELQHLKQLKKITLNLPDLGKTVTAHIDRISPDFDPKTRKINVDLEIRHGNFDFRGGYRTELELEMPDDGGSVIVPKSSLVKAYDDWFLVHPDGVRVKVMILDSKQNGTCRISSHAVKAGQEFLLHP